MSAVIVGASPQGRRLLASVDARIATVSTSTLGRLLGPETAAATAAAAQTLQRRHTILIEDSIVWISEENVETDRVGNTLVQRSRRRVVPIDSGFDLPKPELMVSAGFASEINQTQAQAADHAAGPRNEHIQDSKHSVTCESFSVEQIPDILWFV